MSDPRYIDPDLLRRWHAASADLQDAQAVILAAQSVVAKVKAEITRAHGLVQFDPSTGQILEAPKG